MFYHDGGNPGEGIDLVNTFLNGQMVHTFIFVDHLD